MLSINATYTSYWSTVNIGNAVRAKTVRIVTYEATGAKFSKKVTSLICVKPLATNHDLCRVTAPCSSILYLKIHLEPTMCVLLGNEDLECTSLQPKSRSLVISRSHAATKSLASLAAQSCLYVSGSLRWRFGNCWALMSAAVYATCNAAQLAPVFWSSGVLGIKDFTSWQHMITIWHLHQYTW